MKSLRFAALAALSAAVLTVPASADHAWGDYHWANTAGEVQLTINYSVTSQWTGAVLTAISDWNPSTKLELTGKVSTANRKKCTAPTGQILVCNEAYGPRGWLGIASISLDSQGHITKGTTKLNDTYFNTAQYNTSAWRALVTCQEIGHDFGLGHQDENFDNPNLGTCMDYTSSPGTNQHPNRHDFDQLEAIYDHFDSYGTSLAAAPTNFGMRDFARPAGAADADEVGDSPAQWGRPIRADARGRPDLFEQNLPDGGRRITHVFWTLEARQSDHHHD